MRRVLFMLAALAVLSGCSAAVSPQAPQQARAIGVPTDLPPMKTFDRVRVAKPARSNSEIAQDFIDLTFRLESGRSLPVFTRFEGPITLRVTGQPPPSLDADLDRLLRRLRREARIPITRVSARQPASITIEVLPRAELQRTVPQAACFVVPRLSSWDEFRRNRRSPALDWTTLRTRERMAIFLPGDVSPQEVRDCLHEELAQALGPLNDLYRLTDSVFNDDNFHTVLTGFDMLILRITYADELRSGMTPQEVAARLPAILTRLNSSGRRGGADRTAQTPRSWIEAMETALGPRGSGRTRVQAAQRAVGIARDAGWNDTRTAFSYFALGRLSLPSDPETALAAFLQAARIWGADDETGLQAAHVAMQLAAFALSAGEAETVIELVNASLPPVADAENAALLATLLMVKAEALELAGRAGEAREVRQDSLGWARYGFGSDDEVRARLAEISALAPRAVRAPRT